MKDFSGLREDLVWHDLLGGDVEEGLEGGFITF